MKKMILFEIKEGIKVGI